MWLFLKVKRLELIIIMDHSRCILLSKLIDFPLVVIRFTVYYCSYTSCAFTQNHSLEVLWYFDYLKQVVYKAIFGLTIISINCYRKSVLLQSLFLADGVENTGEQKPKVCGVSTKSQPSGVLLWKGHGPSDFRSPGNNTALK